MSEETSALFIVQCFSLLFIQSIVHDVKVYNGGLCSSSSGSITNINHYSLFVEELVQEQL